MGEIILMKANEIETATEEELREMDVIWPKRLQELNHYITKLSEKNHDYGTAVYAMSMAAVATFYYMSHVVGASGFQASCADMDFIKRIRGYKDGFQIIDYHNLLYPQYDDSIMTRDQLIEDNKVNLKKRAMELLAKEQQASPEVLDRWEWLASL